MVNTFWITCYKHPLNPELCLLGIVQIIYPMFFWDLFALTDKSVSYGGGGGHLPTLPESLFAQLWIPDFAENQMKHKRKVGSNW